MVFRIYGCGSNGRYQLGNGTDEDLDSLELVFESEIGVSKVVCGGNHTFVLLGNGDLFAAGDNSKGQCGIRGIDVLPKFTQLEGKWKDCSAGYEFSVLVGEHNEVYTCGFGMKGELGQGVGVTQTELSRIAIELKDNVISVHSCLDHSLIQLSNGDIYGWGNGRNGKLGVVENKVWSPTLITIPNLKVKKIQLGRDFTLLSDMETIKLYGKDRYGIDSYIPTHFTDFKTMWSSVHLIENNDIRSIGNNSHSQLLSLGEDIQFEDFDVGSEHGLLLSSNTVYAWGWGEHGNCGVKTNSSNSFDLTILFETSEKVVKLQGGCATSWVITAT